MAGWLPRCDESHEISGSSPSSRGLFAPPLADFLRLEYWGWTGDERELGRAQIRRLQAPVCGKQYEPAPAALNRKTLPIVHALVLLFFFLRHGTLLLIANVHRNTNNFGQI